MLKLITISGLDGSGKSTQIQMLRSYLESQGRKVFYFHATQQGLAKKIIDFYHRHCERSEAISSDTRKSEIATVATLPRNDMSKSVTKANSFQVFLRKVFLRIDIWRFERLCNQLHNSGYDYILSDRYFYDSVVNIEFLNLKLGFRNFLKPSFRFRTPDLAVYLDTQPETIMQRDRVPDQGLEYLKKKKELYDAKILQWDWKVVDGNRDRNVVFEEIKSFLGK